MTNDCKTCPVSTGTHKPAEAVHQIAEPQSEALRLAAWLLHRGMSGIKQNDIKASNQLRWLHAESLQHKQELAASRFTVANREARIAELESTLEAIGAGGVELLRKQAAAPQAVQAVQAVVPATNHSETPNSSTIIVPYGWKLVPDGATPDWVANLEALPDWREAVGECIKRFLAAAPAHPAEGVPAQAEAFGAGVDACIDKLNELNHQLPWSLKQSEALSEAIAALEALAATHHTQQGLDVVAAAKALCKHAAKIQNVNFDDYWLIHSDEFKQEAQLVLDAAQAKQGGV